MAVFLALRSFSSLASFFWMFSGTPPTSGAPFFGSAATT